MAALPHPSTPPVLLRPHSHTGAAVIRAPPASPSNTSSEYRARWRQSPRPQPKRKAATASCPGRGTEVVVKASRDHPGPHHPIFSSLQPCAPHVTPPVLQATPRVTPPCPAGHPSSCPGPPGPARRAPQCSRGVRRRRRRGDAARPSATCSWFRAHPARPPLPRFKNYIPGLLPNTGGAGAAARLLPTPSTRPPIPGLA